MSNTHDADDLGCSKMRCPCGYRGWSDDCGRCPACGAGAEEEEEE